jgi:hypothetical protein
VVTFALASCPADQAEKTDLYKIAMGEHLQILLFFVTGGDGGGSDARCQIVQRSK